MKFLARAFVAGLAFTSSVGLANVARADQPTVVVVSGPQPLKAPTVQVHIDSRQNVILEERVEKRTYRAVCASPCDKELPLDATYRIRGDSIRNSPEFRLAGESGERITLTVAPSTRGTFTTGVVVTSIGGGFMVASLMYGVVAGASNIDLCFGGCSSEENARRHARGVEIERNMAIMAGIGLAGLAVGLPVMIGNRATGVAQDSANESRDESRPAPESFIRVPPPRVERDIVAARGASFMVPVSFQF